MMSLFKTPHTPYATMSYSPWSIYKKDVMEKTQESGCGGAAWWWWHTPLIFNPSTWAAEVGGSLWVFYREKYENYKGWCYSGIEHELSID